VNCARLKQMLDALLDGELDRRTTDEMKSHLADCPDCVALKSAREQLRGRLAEGDLSYTLAPATRQRLLAVMATPSPAPAIKRPLRTPQLTWLQALGLAAGAAAMAAVVSATLTLQMSGREATMPTTQQALDEIARHHASSLARASPVDVVSSDTHVIKPWFQGKIDFTPAVRDLTSLGYRLRGARLDSLSGRAAVAVVYQVRNHPINVFVWPRVSGDNLSDTELQLSSARGFSVARWQANDLHFVAVSDVEAGEIQKFAKALRDPIDPNLSRAAGKPGI